MNTVGRDSARAQAQEAFTGLLATPLLAARVQPELFAAVLRHRAIVGDWSARLGYRLVVAGSVIRLHRDPAGPDRTAAPPPWDPPARRDLVLLALAAAACEATDASTTVQELSDEVRALSAGTRVTAYDPDRRAERQAFVRGLGRLAELGILVRRTSDETLLRQWEEDGTGVGAGYEVDRDALLQLPIPTRSSGRLPSARRTPTVRRPGFTPAASGCSASWSRTPRCSTPTCIRSTPSTPVGSVPGWPGRRRT